MAQQDFRQEFPVRLYLVLVRDLLHRSNQAEYLVNQDECLSECLDLLGDLEFALSRSLPSDDPLLVRQGSVSNLN